MTPLAATLTVPATSTAVAFQLKGALAQTIPQVVGAILLVFLTIAIGFIIASYAEAASRRIRPRVISTKEQDRRDDLSPLLLPVLLLGLVVSMSMLMGVKF